MYKIDVSGKLSKRYKLIAKNVAECVLEIMGQPNGLEVAIEFVSEKEIQRLNRETRNIDKITDVLSFPSTNLHAGETLNPQNDEYQMIREDGIIHFGDMAICVKQTKRQAKNYGNTLAGEIKKLVIHSMLHLMGYDHIKDEDFEVMQEKEIELDKKIDINSFKS